eukprot:gene3679-biopygen6150
MCLSGKSESSTPMDPPGGASVSPDSLPSPPAAAPAARADRPRGGGAGGGRLSVTVLQLGAFGGVRPRILMVWRLHMFVWTCVTVILWNLQTAEITGSKVPGPRPRPPRCESPPGAIREVPPPLRRWQRAEVQDAAVRRRDDGTRLEREVHLLEPPPRLEIISPQAIDGRGSCHTCPFGCHRTPQSNVISLLTPPMSMGSPP